MMNFRNKLTLIILGWLILFSFQVSAQTDSAPTKEIKINRKPLMDFVGLLAKKWERKEIDLTKPFLVELSGKLTENGRFDLEKTKYTKSEGDKDIVEMAKSAIEAVGDSGWFLFLRNFEIEDIKIVLKQDKKHFSANIVSEVKSVNKAKNLASGFKGLVEFTKNQTRLEADQMAIIKSMKTPRNVGSKLMLEFEMAKSAFHEIVNRKLKKVSEKKKEDYKKPPNIVN